MAGQVLVTGATGYVGGRLVEALARRGVATRCLARRPDALRSRVPPTVEIVQGDALDAASLARALDLVHTAYYLVHSMGATVDFADLDRQAARSFGRAARDAGVGRKLISSIRNATVVRNPAALKVFRVVPRSLRGALDFMAGGVGMRRGRRDPETLRPGDPLDFWRVEAIDIDRRLRLEAERKLPGRAWLQFDVEPEEERQSRIRQTAIFEPSNAWGRLYWCGLLPVHAVIFSGMLRGIARRAVRERQALLGRQQASGSPT